MDKVFQSFVLQANKIHLTHLLGLLIATLTVMFLGLILIFSLSPTAGSGSGGGGKEGFKGSRKEGFSGGRTDETITLLAVLLSINVFCVSLGGVVFHKKTSEGFLLYISYALTATFMVLVMTLTRSATTLWATVFFVYITYALLPIRLLEATISGVCISIVHIPHFQKELGLPKYTMDRILMNLWLLLSINVVGVLTHFPADMAKRKAFYEIQQNTRAEITIEKETVRQQRLLMSVLPEHLIEEMKTDLAQEGGSISKRKIYMKTYEPVSILFADIVGFTALADRSAGSFVVELLNDLYCSFDKLARNNRCMRIKLLGDCYYCVCGLPKPSAYHASHCVNMGLDMMYAMQMVRQKFNVDVDIRVGIHTGKLQCGVLGLKKWQFDIWSSDVEIANNLESGGVPGKVHISEATKNHLKTTPDTYILEPAYGSSRDPSLKDIETYFVTPSYSGKVKIMQRISMHGPSLGLSPNKAKTEGDPAVPFFNPVKREKDIERELIATLYNSINSRSIRRLKKTNCMSTILRFKNDNMEKKYNQEPDQMLQSYFIAALVVFLTMTTVQMFVMPGTLTLFLCTAVGLLWITFACSLVMARKNKNIKCYPRWFTKLSRKIDRSRNLAQLLALTTVLLSYIVIALPMVMEDSYICRSRPDIEHAEVESLTPVGVIQSNPQNDTCAAKTLPYPEHTSLYTILIMIMTGAFQIVMFTFKFFIMLVLCTSYAVLLITAPYFMKSVVVAEAAIKYFLMIMSLASFLLLMLIQSQQSEIVHRLDFVWKMDARSDTENAQQLQMFNQKLIENILPAHVARHYLEKERPSDELYHEECLSACILFACVTNFSFSDMDGVDSEHNVAILHDIISDIDELLNDSLFSSIEKIKSTGAVYMAASGLSLKRENSDTHEHVVAMAFFALTLRSHIQLINFRHDTSFGVKIGVCMGSVVAGVIGASMPQYDIWGNTVNVASRMYSTGIENQIQVTENVAIVVAKYGFSVEKRGTVFVKGKGSMVTYFLINGPNYEEEIKRLRVHQPPHPPPSNTRMSMRGRRQSKDWGRNSTARASRSSQSSLPSSMKETLGGRERSQGRGSDRDLKALNTVTVQNSPSSSMKMYENVRQSTTSNVSQTSRNSKSGTIESLQPSASESPARRLSPVLDNSAASGSSSPERINERVQNSPKPKNRVSFSLDNDNTNLKNREDSRASSSENNSNNSPRRRIWNFWDKSGSRTPEQDNLNLHDRPADHETYSDSSDGPGDAGNAESSSQDSFASWLWTVLSRYFRGEIN